MVYGECLSCVPWIPINLKFPVTSHSLHYIKAPWHHNEKVQSIAKLRTFPQYLRTQLPPGKGSKFILGHVHHFRSLKSRVDVPNSRGGQSQTSCVNHTETTPSSSWKGATAPPSRDWPRDKKPSDPSVVQNHVSRERELILWHMVHRLRGKHLRFSNNPDFRCLPLLGHLFKCQSPYIIFSHILFGGPKKNIGPLPCHRARHLLSQGDLHSQGPGRLNLFRLRGPRDLEGEAPAPNLLQQRC